MLCSRLYVQCHEVKIGDGGDIVPDVLKANIDDVVAWTFNRYKQNDVHLLSNESGCSDRNAITNSKKYDVNCTEADAKTLAGAVMKPRSVVKQASSTRVT